MIMYNKDKQNNISETKTDKRFLYTYARALARTHTHTHTHTKSYEGGWGFDEVFGEHRDTTMQCVPRTFFLRTAATWH
jgi:hypothetical protein